MFLLPSRLRTCTTALLFACASLLFAQAGQADPAFTAGTNGTVHCVLPLPDGGIIIGGTFTEVNGQGRGMIARLHGDGSLDLSFDPGSGFSGTYGAVRTVQFTSDGKLMVGGSFTAYQGTTVKNVVRLHADGSLDTGFDPGSGPNGEVDAMALLSDGKVLIAGSFTQVSGTTTGRMARLHPDGPLDTGFNLGPTLSGDSPRIRALALRPDGRILAGGGFTLAGGTQFNIVQLLADGAVDASFQAGSGAHMGYHNFVQTIRLAPDGKAYIVGDFTQYNGVFRSRMARIHADGSVDTTWDPGAGPTLGPVISGPMPITTCVLLPDGRLIVGGWFLEIDGHPRVRMACMLPNGTLDPAFDPAGGPATPTGSLDLSEVLAMALLPDGDVLAGGTFTQYDGLERSNLVKVRTGTSSGVKELDAAPLHLLIDATTLRVDLHRPAAQLQLLDAMGRIVRERSRTLELNIGDLPNAAYVVRAVLPDGGQRTARWVKAW